MGTSATRLPSRLLPVAWSIALLALAASGFALTRNNWWDPGGVDSFYGDHFSQATGYEGTDEYSPAGSDRYDLDRKAPRVAILAQGQAAATAGIEIQQWAPESKRFAIDSPAPVLLAVRLLNYPAWKLEVNGRREVAHSAPGTGQMLVHVPAGLSHVRIVFTRTPDRLYGTLVSAIALLLLMAAFLASPRGG